MQVVFLERSIKHPFFSAWLQPVLILARTSCIYLECCLFIKISQCLKYNLECLVCSIHELPTQASSSTLSSFCNVPAPVETCMHLPF